MFIELKSKNRKYPKLVNYNAINDVEMRGSDNVYCIDISYGNRLLILDFDTEKEALAEFYRIMDYGKINCSYSTKDCAEIVEQTYISESP